MPCTPYDPADAKRLVAASGYPTPISVHLLTSGNTLLAQFIQSEEKAVGINVVLDVTDNVTEVARRTSGSFDADVISSGVVPGDPSAPILVGSIDGAVPLYKTFHLSKSEKAG